LSAAARAAPSRGRARVSLWALGLLTAALTVDVLIWSESIKHLELKVKLMLTSVVPIILVPAFLVIESIRSRRDLVVGAVIASLLLAVVALSALSPGG